MPALMKMQDTGKSTEITLTVPKTKAMSIGRAIGAMLDAAGLKVHRVNENGEELFSIEEVFPDSHPGTVLRGLRLKEELTQGDMAARLKIPQSHLSALESGKKHITLEMAKRIAEEFDTSYKVFL